MSNLIFPILLLVVFLQVNAEDQCKNNNETHCMCLYTTEYEYQCPPTNVRAVIHTIPETYLKLDCYDMETFDVDILPNYNSSNSTTITISFCPLPENNFVPMLNKFNVQTVQQLQLDNISIPEKSPVQTISKNIFTGLSDVEVLTISRVLNKLDNDLLDNLPKLSQFYLENSEINNLSDFKLPSTLIGLRITGNELTEVPNGIFQNLTKLKQLHLWSNKITHVKRNEFITLKSLISLELSLNNISNIAEDSFAGLSELKTINLRANKLHEIQPTIFKHNNKLKSIRMEDNPHLILPEKIFANFQELEIVNLKNSGIDVLPENIFDNSVNIITIHLHRNNITKIPDGIFKKLSKLQTLNLSYNRIDVLSGNVFSDLVNLQELNLDNNSLSVIDNNLFKNTKNLITLSLRYNKISEIDVSAFMHLDKLESIDLSYNLFEFSYDYDSNPFTFCQALQKIILRNNNIRKFPPLLGSTISIKHIDLSFNKIKEVLVADITSASSQALRSINLSNNEIHYVDFLVAEQQAQVNLMNLDAMHNKDPSILVDLRNNPLTCDCKIYNLARYYQGYMEGVRTKVNLRTERTRCSEPKAYRHINIADIKPEQVTCEMHFKTCPKECQCYWRPYTDAIELDCSNRNLTYFPKLNFVDKKIVMNLNGNYISGGLTTGLGYENVTTLVLSDNKLKELKWIPLGIKILTLDQNELTHLDSKLLELMKNATYLTTIKLSNNPWACGCSAFELQTFIKKHFKQVNPKDVICKEDHKPLIEKMELCKSSASLIMTIVSPIVGFLFLTVISLIFYIHYRQEVKVWLYAKNLCLWWVTEEELDEDKIYDIFISYSNKDEDFVMQNLLPVLEGGPKPFKTCIHIRDWEPGEMIITHVTNSVLNSRRTLVVLSNNFLESVWGIQEFKTAHTQAIKDGRARVIVVKYGQLDESRLDEGLKAYLNANTYVEWGQPWFWNKLKYALPHYRKNGFYKSNQKHASIMSKLDDRFELTSPPLTHPVSTPPVITLDPEILKNHPLNFYKVNETKFPSTETPLVLNT